MALSGKQVRYLRGLGHHLSPVVQVGHGGITDGVVKAVDQALLDHELVKLKVSENAPEDRRETARILAQRTGSEEVQVLGRTVLLYRPHPDTPRIALPKARPSEDEGPEA